MEKEAEKKILDQEIKNVIEELLQKMGFSAEISVKKSGESEEDGYLVDIKTDESNFLIGQYGINLQALQHLSRVVVRSVLKEKVNFVLDVNSYRQEKNDSVIKLAHSLVEQCLGEKRAIVMRPMSPYERRLIHLELSKNEKVRTESIGEGEERRIVIKPADLI